MPEPCSSSRRDARYSLRVGSSWIEFDNLKSTATKADDEATLGGLFFPADREFEQRLQGIVAGLDAARPAP